MNEEKWFSKEIDADRFYTVIEGLFTQVEPPFVLANMQIVPNGMFWSLLLYKIIELGQEYSANPIQKECNNNEEYATAYGAYNIETTMFVLGLMTLSWLKINIKKTDIAVIQLMNQNRTNQPHARLVANFISDCMMII